jgi:hypothetical protein
MTSPSRAPTLPLAVSHDQIWIVASKGRRSIAARVAINPDRATFLALPTGQFDTQAELPVYPRSGALMPALRWATFTDICTYQPIFPPFGRRSP